MTLAGVSVIATPALIAEVIYMYYAVRLYISTGFNVYNIPDRPSLLDDLPYIDVSAIDTLQQRWLTSIRVRASWDAIKNVDYARIVSGDDVWYYTVDEIQMQAADVARLLLSPDYLLSAGGAASLTYTDGITRRVHIPIEDDVYGAYVEDDPLTAPAMPMELRTVYITDPSHEGQVYDTVTLVESVLDLSATADDQDALTYTDSITGETVTVPQASPLTSQTVHEFGGEMGTGTWSLTGFGSAGTRKAINKLLSLGMEGTAIRACYSLPLDYIVEDVTAGNNEMIQTLTGKRYLTETGIPYQMHTVANRRLLYGEYTKYGILTAAGNRCEYRPEDIYHDGDTSPRVRCIPDVRSGGRPYYRYEYYLGDSSDVNYWYDCVAGAEWAQMPLVYTDKSGSALDRMQFEADRKQAAHSYNTQLTQAVRDATGGLVSSVGSGVVSGALAGGGVGAAIGAASGLVTGAVGYQQAREQIDRARTQYGMQRQAAYLDYMVSQTVQPEVQYPYNADIVRDAQGNGVWCYRYVYRDADLARIDRLLSMYGYRHTKSLQSDDFTTRSKYNYVQADGVAVTAGAVGRLPRWWSDGIAYQLSGGVRVWHVIPDVSAYDDGSNT